MFVMFSETVLIQKEHLFFLDFLFDLTLTTFTLPLIRCDEYIISLSCFFFFSCLTKTQQTNTRLGRNMQKLHLHINIIYRCIYSRTTLSALNTTSVVHELIREVKLHDSVLQSNACDDFCRKTRTDTHTRIHAEICFHYFNYMKTYCFVLTVFYCFVYADSLLQLTAIYMDVLAFLHGWRIIKYYY